MTDEWFIGRDDQVAGPFTGRQVKELAASGRLSRNDGIRRGRKGEFVAASKARGLFSGDTNATRQEAPLVELGATRGAVSMPTTAVGASSASQLRSKLLLAGKRIKLAGPARRVTEAASSLCQMAHSAWQQFHHASSIRRHISTLLARPHLTGHTLGEDASQAIDARVPLPQLGQFGKYGVPLLVGLSIGFLYSLCVGRVFSHMLLGGLVSIGISQLAIASLPAIALDRFPLRFSAIVVAVLLTSGFLWRAWDKSADHPVDSQLVKRNTGVEGFKLTARTTAQAASSQLSPGSTATGAFMVPYVANPNNTVTKVRRPKIKQVSRHGRFAVIYGGYPESATSSESQANRSQEQLWDLNTNSVIPLPLALLRCTVSPDETLLAGVCDESLVVIELGKPPSVRSKQKLMFTGKLHPAEDWVDISWSPNGEHILVTWDSHSTPFRWDLGYRWLPNETRSGRGSWITEEERMARMPQQKDLLHVKFVGEVFNCRGGEESVVLAVPPHDNIDVSEAAAVHEISPDGTLMVWGIDNGVRVGLSSKPKKSWFFNLASGRPVYAGDATLGFSPKGTYFLTMGVSPSQGNEDSHRIDSVVVWDTHSREQRAKIPIERNDGGFDLSCTADERFLLVADQENHAGEQRAFELPSGEFGGAHAYLAGEHARPTGYRRKWRGVDTPKGPVEIWGPDGSAPAFVVGTSDLRQRNECMCAADGSVVVTISRPHNSRGGAEELIEVWKLGAVDETIPLVSFRQRHMDAAPTQPLEQHFILTQEEEKEGWALPAGYVTVASTVRHDQVALLKKGMRREDVQDLLGGVSHKMLVRHSRYDTTDTRLGSIWIWDWIDVYAGEEPQSSLWLHFRKDADFTYEGGTLIDFKTKGFR